MSEALKVIGINGDINGEWVRRALRDAGASRPAIDPETKLQAVRRGAQYSFPAADIEQMLSEIERGYQG